MNELEIKKLIRQQRAFFYKGRTLPVKTRIHMLKRLRCCILKYQEEIRSTAKPVWCLTSSGTCLDISVNFQRKKLFPLPFPSLPPEAM